ncbi:MAG: tryptophan--tRNA ligase [Deltaproteobacteria bacterium]|nr:tryptophan--tRNA ligase [Deltaproteobacteria bacterium]
MKEKTVLSGMRPTGKLHLGHLHGVLENWKKLQDEYDCLFFVADWHSLTSEYADTKGIEENINEMIIDWLSFGIDPENATLFVQSRVMEHAELHLLLSMITPLPWLERVPTYKEQMDNIRDKDLGTYGFLGYPLLQSADILLYKADFVPVGIDQVPHVEFTREVARRFNFLYGNVLPEPQHLLTQYPKLPGTDGRKMSKSYNNSIYLSDGDEVITKKIKTAMTDPQRVRRTDPGDPELCPIYAYHKIYSSDEQKDYVVKGCKSADIGCIECKKILTRNILEELAPIRERRQEYMSNPARVKEIVEEGNKKAGALAKKTMEEVRRAVRI